MEEHFAENVTLDELLSMTDFGKSYLLRSFTRQTGGVALPVSSDDPAGQGEALPGGGIAPIDAAGWPDFRTRAILPTF